MELWVRSQDREHLMKTTDIDISCDDKTIILINNYEMAKYKTKERALEVLNEIQSRITRNEALKTMMPNVSTLKGYEEKFGELFKEMIYEMPED